VAESVEQRMLSKCRVCKHAPKSFSQDPCHSCMTLPNKPFFEMDDKTPPKAESLTALLTELEECQANAKRITDKIRLLFSGEVKH
jgi:hypothetical protein